MTRSTLEAAPARAAEIIQVPNTLRLKIGPRFGAMDAAAIAKAEEALKGLAGEFGQWLQEEVDKLEAARATVKAGGATPKAMDQLYLHAHDLKGLGTTYEYPLISRIASSLCKLMDGPSGRDTAALFLVDAHIDAIRAIVRGEIRDPEHPVGRTLAQALDMRVKGYIEKNGSSTAP